MEAIRRYTVLLIVLVLGVVLGTLGWQAALVVLTPLVMIWLMVWDEKSYKSKQHERYIKEKQQYMYRNSR
ncbi:MULTISPECIES: hypothetical protein [Vagococcus]|uniref:Uncharacterized protein n=1 Tax=Vagococcus fluvialis bH819 TaxID=1255619 RepID=A0A1X6WLI9_9ENTE|nr:MULTISPECIES: hypothetical protein [Vagococcus]SLM84546.1 hypothetical protein FM121_00540 [Vagococcus fluvialis bH819]HCM89989.1 hypothetical protein [Vagococcus sp.]